MHLCTCQNGTITFNNLNDNIMTVFANLSNGNQTQIIIKGDNAKIIKFIEQYLGDDLGNDLICQDFVTDFEETGVIIEIEK